MYFLTESVESEIIVKKSRFISVLCSCNDSEELKEIKKDLLSKHKSSSHIVHAAIFSSLSEFSYSDNKEPKGTAGLPTFNVLHSVSAINVALFTIRYFGGTLLGVGGLKRAYTDSAKKVLENAKFEWVEELETVNFSVNFSDFGKIKRFLSERNIKYEFFQKENCTDIAAEIKKADMDAVSKNLEDIIKGKIIRKGNGF